MPAYACATGSDTILVSSATICIDGLDAGFTEGGITMSYEPTFLDVFADQLKGKIAKVLTDETLTIAANFTSMSLDNLRKAFGLPESANFEAGSAPTPPGLPQQNGTADTTTSPAGDDYVAIHTALGIQNNGANNCLSLGGTDQCGQTNRVELALIGEAPGCCSRIFYFPCVQPSGGFEISLSRDAVQQLSVTFEALKLDDGTFGRVCDDCSGTATCATAETLVYGA